MSDMLKSLIGDDDEYYSDDDYDGDENYSDEQIDEEEEEFDHEENDKKQQEELERNITMKVLSEKNKIKKKKFIVPSQKESQQEQPQVLMMTEEEMQHYQNLKLFGIEGPKLKKQEEVNEEVNFKLDVLQSSKMFFEEVDPTVVSIYFGSKAFKEQENYIMSNYWKLLEKYNSRDDLYKHELTEPRYVVEEYSHNKSFNFVQQLLNRTDHMTCLSEDHKYLFICGGVSGKTLQSDFIVYDLTKGRLNLYRDMTVVSKMGNYKTNPALVGQFMYQYGDSIYIIGSSIHIVENVFDPLQIHYDLNKGWSYNPSLYSQRNFFSHSSALSEGGMDIYVFGGKTVNSIVDDLYIIHIPRTVTAQNTVRCTKLEKPRRGEGEWPSARYGHSSCSIANLMFIYGGVNSKNELLNDLHVFDTSTQTWSEINVESMLPPPVYKHQAFTINNQSFYIYGGIQMNENSNSIFRFDIMDKKWSLMEIVSDERKARLAGHQCLIAQGKLWIIGGNSTLENSEKKPRSFVKLMNLNDPGKRLPICDYLETKRKEGYLCDLVFKLKDKKANSESTDSISYILAHKCIIKARCAYLEEKVQSSSEKISCNEFEGTFLEEELTIVDVTECDTNIFEKYLDYLYTGTIKLDNSKEVEQFLKFVKLVSETKHFQSIQKICTLSLRKDLSLTKEILEVMHKDFTSLIDDKTYSDLVIVLDQENDFNQPPPFESEEDGDELLSPLSASTIPSSGIFIHKLIVSRSPFFSRMFVTSGMLESKQKVVHLQDYSKEVMMDLLKYLYTDIIQLTPRNCLGILVYCLMLDLTDLASCCRRMVSSLLDNTNIWTIHEIAVLYNEKTLESSCEHYIAENYVTLSTNSAFLELPGMSRIKIKQIYDRKNKK